jgi:hypothetical protein
VHASGLVGGVDVRFVFQRGVALQIASRGHPLEIRSKQAARPARSDDQACVRAFANDSQPAPPRRWRVRQPSWLRATSPRHLGAARGNRSAIGKSASESPRSRFHSIRMAAPPLERSSLPRRRRAATEQNPRAVARGLHEVFRSERATPIERHLEERGAHPDRIVWWRMLKHSTRARQSPGSERSAGRMPLQRSNRLLERILRVCGLAVATERGVTRM